MGRLTFGSANAVFEPPDNWVLGRVAESLLLFHDDDQALYVDGFGSSPAGFLFTFTLVSRTPIQRYEQGPLHDPRGDDITVRYADGSTSSAHHDQSGKSVQLVPRVGGGTPTTWRREWWCTPLPPPGPVEFRVDLSGHEAKGSIDGDVLLEAAERAVQLWPDRQVEPPLIDTTTAPALPPPGPAPSDPESARDQIRAAYVAALDHGAPGADKMSAIQDGPALEGARQQARANHPVPTSTIRLGLGEIVFIDEVRAAVHFQLNWSGAMTFGPQLGYAVLEGARWKVARDTYCRVLGWAGVTCPPPPPPRPMG